jgi:hypothetical protein
MAKSFGFAHTDRDLPLKSHITEKLLDISAKDATIPGSRSINRGFFSQLKGVFLEWQINLCISSAGARRTVTQR